MKNYLLLSVLFLMLSACNLDKKSKNSKDLGPPKKNEKEIEQYSEKRNKSEEVVIFDDFDWSKIPLSDKFIGEFPYISPPEGFEIQNQKKDRPYSKFWDFNKLIVYTGVHYYNAEGKRAEISINEKEGAFNEYKLRKSIENYLLSIGATEISDYKMTKKELTFLKKDDDKLVYNHITGNPWNNKLKTYALNHEKGKIFFQLWSNTAQGEIGILELKGFKQTIKAPTASEIKNAIEKDGKAILYINFDIDKATLKPDGEKVITEIYKALQELPDLKISIEGHTDNTGQASYNKVLSEKRANTVKYSLAAKGIEIERLESKGFGAEVPLESNETEVGRSKNRRVELVRK